MELVTTEIAGGESKEKVTPLNWRYYLALTKPTIGLLVVVTMVPALFLAQQTLPSLSVVFAALCGTFLASCSAGAFNHVVDLEVDRGMVRTRMRPLASGRLDGRSGLYFAVGLGFASILILSIWTTPAAVWLSVAANAFYVLFYTMYLKRRTPQNIVIGGAAGAVGPLIGWAAVAGDVSNWVPWALFGIIFLWTPPHFWALALKYKDDYGRAGIPMLPVVAGDEETRKQIYWYALSLVPVVGLVYTSPLLGWGSLAVNMMLTIYFAYLARKLYLAKTNDFAMPVFHYSCFYLFGIFGAITVERLLAVM
jgi:heme o synthase